MTRLRLGTRGSRLALWQAEWVRDELTRCVPDAQVELVVIRVESDRQPEVPITSMESRGVFTKDIEVALLSGEVDVAVHSLKDLPSEDPEGLVLAATSPRADPRDALLTVRGESLADLPGGAVVGTSSLRRCALVREARPDVEVRPLRGNIDTRLRKLDSGDYDAIVMAAAAIERLELDLVMQPLDPAVWVPAIAQGIIGLQARADDGQTRGLLAAVGDRGSMHCASVERSFLRALGGGCSVPVGGMASMDGERMVMRGFAGSPDGKRTLRTERSAELNATESLGRQVAADLISMGADRILEELREDTPLLHKP